MSEFKSTLAFIKCLGYAEITNNRDEAVKVLPQGI